MIGLISQLFGIYDVLSLVLIMSINACMNFFGLIHETTNGGRKPGDVDWTPFVYGCFAGVKCTPHWSTVPVASQGLPVAGAVPWAIIFVNIGGNASAGNIPGFVWGILAAYLFFFNTLYVRI